MGEIRLDGFICDRCDHTWVSRNGFDSEQKPLVCPKCKTPYWNIPRKNGVKKEREEDFGLFPKITKKKDKRGII